ncbi:MAG TPA: hypothetical protein VL400_03500 [Polyangiaceae bacterium]|nr:hypothetical protein [Polyangiaceae bacterium]
MRRISRTVLFPGLLATAALGLACTTQIPAVGDSGVGGDSSGVVGSSGEAQVATSVSTGAGTIYDTCGAFEDLGACDADTTALDALALDAAGSSLVRTWRRCDTSEPGAFDVGVSFRIDGRVYRVYRQPNVGGDTDFLLYCGSDLSDAGSWTLTEKADPQSSGSFDLMVTWDSGQTTQFEVSYYEGATRLGLFDAPTSEDPELFAPAGDSL